MSNQDHSISISTMTSPPAPLSNDGSVFSLLSLSIAAANAAPIPVSDSSASSGNLDSTTSVNGALSSSVNETHAATGGAIPSTSVGSGVKQHRRLASTGKARRRLSDARDAASRPSPAALQTAAAALSLASLSLSSSPPLPGHGPTSASFTAASNALSSPMTVPPPSSHSPNDMGMSTSVPDDGSNLPSPPSVGANGTNGNMVNPIAIGGAKNGKKRGMDHKCESCSKIYRHPSCLIKHRWEHTPHWREASKFVLSKHQQVQLLEAAAILSHLSPSSSTGTSLPEDRSLWPSFLSGGSLPPPSADGTAPTTAASGTSIPTSTSPYAATHPTSSSVPASAILGSGNPTRATSAGPRLHDYSIPTFAGGAGGITQLRPGLLGVPTGPGLTSVTVSTSSTQPVPVPNAGNAFGTYRTVNGNSESWGSPYGVLANGNVSSYQSAALSNSLSQSYAHSDERSGGRDTEGERRWSLPRSSMRSVSVSSQSRSRSGSASESRSDESLDVDVDVDLDDYGYGRSNARGYGFGSRGRAWKSEDDDDLSIGFSVREEDEGEEEVKRKEPEWDGMEMEMEMD